MALEASHDEVADMAALYAVNFTGADCAVNRQPIQPEIEEDLELARARILEQAFLKREQLEPQRRPLHSTLYSELTNFGQQLRLTALYHAQEVSNATALTYIALDQWFEEHRRGVIKTIGYSGFVTGALFGVTALVTVATSPTAIQRDVFESCKNPQNVQMVQPKDRFANLRDGAGLEGTVKRVLSSGEAPVIAIPYRPEWLGVCGPSASETYLVNSNVVEEVASGR